MKLIINKGTTEMRALSRKYINTAPFMVAMLLIVAGMVMVMSISEPDTADVARADIPWLYYPVDMGWTLWILGVVLVMWSAIQLSFKVKGTSIFSTPKWPAILVYANLSLLSGLVLGAISIVTELDRGYYPPGADSIGIPIFGLLIFYVLTVIPANVVTFAIIFKRYKAGVALRYAPLKKASRTKKIFFYLIVGLLMLGFLYSVAYASLATAILLFWVLAAVVCEFYGVAFKGKSKQVQ
jgi:hypothetical protein